MTSPRNTTQHTLTLVLSLIFLLNPPLPAKASPATNLISQACNKITDYRDWNTTKCIEILESNPQISSIMDLPTLATTIINVGLVNATNTRSSIQEKAKGASEPKIKSALDACVVWYDDSVTKFISAMGIIKEDVDHDAYDSATYTLLMAGHDINYCDNLLVMGNVEDSSIYVANKFVVIFCGAAGQVTTILSNQKRSPSPSPIPQF